MMKYAGYLVLGVVLTSVAFRVLHRRHSPVAPSEYCPFCALAFAQAATGSPQQSSEGSCGPDDGED